MDWVVNPAMSIIGWWFVISLIVGVIFIILNNGSRE